MFKRIVAILGIILILALVVTASIMGFTGNPNFIKFMALAIVVPVIIAVMLGIARFLDDKKENHGKNIYKETKEQSSKEKSDE